MSITKKWLAFCLAVCMIMPLVAGCGEIATKKEDGKLHIVTTVFPYYDFAKQIGGDRVSVDLIVPAGMDIHSFEPTAKDMVTIGEADVFIYNGGTMESWVPKVLEAAEGKDITTLRMMDHVKVVDEEIVEGMQEEEHEHEHADGDHDDAEETEQDEHIWTAPLNCVKLVDEIAAAFAKADPDHSQEYLNRAEQYTAQLKDLDMQIRQIVAGAKHKEMVFGDRFPLRYFTDAYGLTYRAAFPGCSSDMEPSADTIAYLIDRIKQQHISVVLQVEMSSSKVADTIAEATGAKVETYQSCHTVSKKQFDAGVTYLSLMQENLQVLKDCLN